MKKLIYTSIAINNLLWMCIDAYMGKYIGMFLFSTLAIIFTILAQTTKE